MNTLKNIGVKSAEQLILIQTSTSARIVGRVLVAMHQGQKNVISALILMSVRAII
ncbi:MAG: hypothetical protein MI862_26105 [Desulfobacterales bacterium]|nr:hypothetical protein [Desulfobacterales bacterium]